MHHLYIFGYDFFDLVIFIFLWVGGWNILEYVIAQYVDTNDKVAYAKANVVVTLIGIALLYIKHWLLKSPYI